MIKKFKEYNEGAIIDIIPRVEISDYTLRLKEILGCAISWIYLEEYEKYNFLTSMRNDDGNVIKIIIGNTLKRHFLNRLITEEEIIDEINSIKNRIENRFPVEVEIVKRNAVSGIRYNMFIKLKEVK